MAKWRKRRALKKERQRAAAAQDASRPTSRPEVRQVFDCASPLALWQRAWEMAWANLPSQTRQPRGKKSVEGYREGESHCDASALFNVKQTLPPPVIADTMLADSA